MADRRIRALDPLGIVALAHVVVRYGPEACCECSCEGIPICGCETDECSCQNIPVECTCDTECSCEGIPVCPPESDLADILDMVSNPVFRKVVQGFDMKKMKTIEDFLSIVNEIQKKLDSAARQTDYSASMK